MIEHPKLQDALVRAGNFNEVSFGYTKEQMISESKRCLQCKKPLCVQGCPVNIDIPGFIKYLVADDAVSALKKIKEKNNLPGVCGRVCPQEDQCEQACVLHKKGTAIKIGYLERYAADYGQTESNPSSAFRLPPSAYKVAVVGAGPAGLTCSADLAMLGVQLRIITGDNKLVALHAANTIGLKVNNVLTGSDIMKLNDESLWNMIEKERDTS